MKPEEIQIGGLYEGRNGSVREVTGAREGGLCDWVLVSRAKHPHFKTGEPREHGAHVGERGTCTIQTLARWAMRRVSSKDLI